MVETHDPGSIQARLLENARYCRTVAPLSARQGRHVDAERWAMFAEDFGEAAAALSTQPPTEVIRDGSDTPVPTGVATASADTKGSQR